MQNVIVFVQHMNGQTPKVTFEMATQARTLADRLGGKAYAIVVGTGASSIAEALKSYPLDIVYCANDDDVDRYLLDPVIDYIEAAARAAGPSLVLVPNTLMGKDVAGRLVARLDAGLCADVTDFKIEAGTIECVMPKFGGAAITTCRLNAGDYGIATVRPNAFAAQAGGAGAAIEAMEKPAGKTYACTIENDTEETSGELPLEEAPVVIAGGRGLGGPEPFDTLLKPLAQAFGGAVGASRAAADAGWVPYSLQIGQTGKTVSPSLYIAIGISGAIQHKVGMRSSGTIVAINKDGQSPIAEFSDLTVVGDAFAIVPELTKLVQSARA
ncbi:MAG: electron transfer flavoprotein subunit alpha/FixB family protein [Candidatus Eremiobacteraeota bacterium]|nr:electron transfer flavoprotein subunit alpha/FixB family protein [Candidatus Eremiobacteraeota bacterium]